MKQKHKFSKTGENFEYQSISDLTEQELHELLNELEIDTNDMHCHFCKEKLSIQQIGGILPGDDTNRILLICKSMICFIQYDSEFILEGK